MTFEELFADKGFQVKTNVELALYALAEQLGVPKEDILNGVYDLQFNEAMIRIYKQFKILLEDAGKE